MPSKRGPKVEPGVGELKPHTVVLDDKTVRKAKALGTNLSDGLRKAVRVAYDRYQRTPDNGESK